MEQSSTPALELGICPDCGATAQPSAQFCWLCGRKLDAKARPAPAKAARSTADQFLTVTAIVVAIVAALVVIGTAQDDPGMAVLLLLVMAPAFLATLVASHKARAKGKPMTIVEKVARFLMTLAVTMGIVAVIALAAIGAFFVWCLTELSKH